jgi:hypothetical protein
MSRFTGHQALGRELLATFPELEAALGWRIVDWMVLRQGLDLIREDDSVPPLAGVVDRQDGAQLLRLLSEILDIGLDTEVRKTLLSNMDLTEGQLDALFNRADAAWQRLKAFPPEARR